MTMQNTHLNWPVMTENKITISGFAAAHYSPQTEGKSVISCFTDDYITFAELKNLRASLRVSQAGGPSSSVSAAGC